MPHVGAPVPRPEQTRRSTRVSSLRLDLRQFETQDAQRRGRSPAARGRTIAGAIVRSAQERVALDDAAWRLAGGQRQIVQFGAARINRVFSRVTRPIPIACPLPDIANHVIKPVAVWLDRDFDIMPAR
jgi:hypothetical protein